MKKGFCRRKALSPGTGLLSGPAGHGTGRRTGACGKGHGTGVQETDASEFYGLFTHSDSEVTVTVKNDAKQNGNGWEQAGFTHAGRPVVQSSAESGKYAGLALEVSRPCYLVYDYTLASKSSSSLYHKTAANLTKTSGTTSYTNLSSSGARSDYQDEGEVAAGAWKTAVVDLTDANTSNRVLWLEHYRSSSDKNPIARAYVSNLRFYESLESLPEAYKATVDFRFNPEHGYVESKYYSKKTNIETPSVLVFPIYSKLSLYFRYEEEIDVQGWKSDGFRREYRQGGPGVFHPFHSIGKAGCLYGGAAVGADCPRAGEDGALLPGSGRHLEPSGRGCGGFRRLLVEPGL